MPSEVYLASLLTGSIKNRSPLRYRPYCSVSHSSVVEWVEETFASKVNPFLERFGWRPIRRRSAARAIIRGSEVLLPSLPKGFEYVLYRIHELSAKIPGAVDFYLGQNRYMLTSLAGLEALQRFASTAQQIVSIAYDMAVEVNRKLVEALEREGCPVVDNPVPPPPVVRVHYVAVDPEATPENCLVMGAERALRRRLRHRLHEGDCRAAARRGARMVEEARQVHPLVGKAYEQALAAILLRCGGESGSPRGAGNEGGVHA